MTRTLARQMSGPVPSPSMKGMIGWSGTLSLPFAMVIFLPCAGGVTVMGLALDIADSCFLCLAKGCLSGKARMLARAAITRSARRGGKAPVGCNPDSGGLKPPAKHSEGHHRGRSLRRAVEANGPAVTIADALAEIEAHTVAARPRGEVAVEHVRHVFRM